MANCNKCDSEIEKDDLFCPYCGAAQKGETPPDAEKSVESDSNSRILDLNPTARELSEDSKANETDEYKSLIVNRPDEIESLEATGDNKAVNHSAAVAAEGEEEIGIIDTSERHSADADESGEPLIPQDDLPEIGVSHDEFDNPYGAENQNESTLSEYEEIEILEGADVEAINKITEEDINRRGEESNSEPEIDSQDADVSNHEPTADSVQTEDDAAVPEKSKTVETGENLDVSPEIKEARQYTEPNIGASTDGKKSAKLKPLDAGTILNSRYEIVRKIGGGGMGAVYLATDKNLGGALRAVKEMVQSYIEDEQQEKAIADFKRESILLTSLEHQSIPTIYDYFFDENEGRFYLVMKYISGGDLSLRLRAAPEGRIDEPSVTEWAIQIADVLDYLHNRQPPIIYRDLKPANVMVDGNTGRAMLIDFGIARWVKKEEKGVTAVGTMGYAPPELFSGNVEPRSDIYSLGSTMFHLLTGADPQSNPLLIFDFQKHPRPRQINPQLSDQIEKILMRMVEYSAEKRFATAAQLRGELEKHLENLKAKRVTHGVKEVPESIALSEQPVFCGFCGQKIVATDMFCAFCGAKQPMAQKGIHLEEISSKSMTAKLLIIGTTELETPAYTIDKDDNLLGRRDPMSNIFPEVDLSKYDPQTKISRRHARIRRRGGDFLVEDLGSSNGTVVMPVINETVRLSPHKPYALRNGDKLKLGDTTLHFISG